MIDDSFIGKIDVSDGLNVLFERINDAKLEIIDMNNVQPVDICVLSDGNLLSLNFDQANLTVYDKDFNLIKTIDKANNIQLKPSGVASDDEQRIYITNLYDHSVIMFDTQLNFIKSYGSFGANKNQLNYPNGICYSNNHVYVCDCNNERVQILTSDLNLIKSELIGYCPWKICIIGETACVSCAYGSELCFYSLNNFMLKHRYSNGFCRLIAFNSVFYEFIVYLKLPDGRCVNEKRLNCYNNEGKFMKSINLEKFKEYFVNGWDACVVYFNKTILISSYSKSKLLKLKF